MYIHRLKIQFRAFRKQDALMEARKKKADQIFFPLTRCFCRPEGVR